jgi:DNA primase
LQVPLPTVRERLHELRAAAQKPASPASPKPSGAPAPALEKELIQVLLAEPGLVPDAAAAVAPEQLQHPGLQRLLREMYVLHAEGQTVDLDALRSRLDRKPRLIAKAFEFQEIGRANPDRVAWLRRIVAEFNSRQAARDKQHLHTRLQAPCDHTEAVELLRRLQQRTDAPP